MDENVIFKCLILIDEKPLNATKIVDQTEQCRKSRLSDYE